MKRYFLLAAAALALTACSNDDENLNVNNDPVEARITAGVSGPATRAIDNVWEADEIGVMVQSVTGTTAGITSVMADMYKNVKYTTSATTDAAANFSPDGTGIFFQDAKETVTFSAYGPYQTSTAANVLPGMNGVVSGSTAAQSDRDAQKAIDYIFATGATASRTSPTVEFNGDNAFKHKMARLVIVVKPGDNVMMDDFAKDGTNFVLNGLKHNGTFNVTTGEAAATGEVSDWSLTGKSLLATAADAYTFTSIVYPQTLGSALTFKATIDGQDYINNSDINPALAAGMSYTYTITVNKTGLTVSGCTIAAWGNGGSGSGNATMQ